MLWYTMHGTMNSTYINNYLYVGLYTLYLENKYLLLLLYFVLILFIEY